MRPYAAICTAILMLAGCTAGHLRPHRMTVIATTDTASCHKPTPPLTNDDWQQQQAAVRGELDYYLERHSATDEGYAEVAGFASDGRPVITLPSLPATPFSNSRWRFNSRWGGGTERDTCGRLVVGYYEADTLSWGLRLDSLGVYIGDFSRQQADGNGRYQGADGSYYEGGWQADRRQGFGFGVSPATTVQAGYWRANRFLGERMSHNTDRVYGIDISKYQHGTGRKQHPIRWSQLRITHLGSLSEKRISGQVDYPVAFVFIKSTEGTSIRNAFYATDYRNARKHGVPVGAYHFFSTKSGGKAQATFFLRHTRLTRGDLPPVLDVEPTEQQIRAMGGEQVLLNNVRIWLSTVEQRVGVRPILYVSQTFVVRHLSQAPDLKRRYKVWIARYGEYKPDVKLAFWQLSPDGRVRGIEGLVDINVFNGYRTQFNEFLKQETVR